MSMKRKIKVRLDNTEEDWLSYQLHVHVDYIMIHSRLTTFDFRLLCVGSLDGSVEVPDMEKLLSEHFCGMDKLILFL